MRGNLFIAAQELAANFYAWERRGRGWDIWPYPCELEPAFRPFPGHYLPSTFVDDARRPGLLSRLFGSPTPAPALPKAEEDEPIPEPLERRAQDLVELQVLLPDDFELRPESSEQLLSSLSFCNRPVSFELIATTTAISLQLACDRSDRAHVAAQLRAFAPDAALVERSRYLAGLWCTATFPHLIVELGLSNEFMRPLRGLKHFSTAPYLATVGALSGLVWARSPWSKRSLPPLDPPGAKVSFGRCTIKKESPWNSSDLTLPNRHLRSLKSLCSPAASGSLSRPAPMSDAWLCFVSSWEALPSTAYPWQTN